MAVVSVVGLAGILMVKLVPASQQLTRLGGLWLTMTVAPVFPLLLSLASSNVTGSTAKSTAMAMMFIGFAAGNWTGPQFFIASEAPTYPVSSFGLVNFFTDRVPQTAYTVILVCYATTLGLLAGLRVYLFAMNKRRDRTQGCCIDPEDKRFVDLHRAAQLRTIDETTKQNRDFRYIL
jgi:MFS transporter, ACS family, allantoate permease